MDTNHFAQFVRCAEQRELFHRCRMPILSEHMSIPGEILRPGTKQAVRDVTHFLGRGEGAVGAPPNPRLRSPSFSRRSGDARIARMGGRW
eukprot:2293084-Pyramimonas_sp.AAC.1